VQKPILTSPEELRFGRVLTNILVIGAENLGSDTGEPGPILQLFEWRQRLAKRGTLDGIHEAKALPPFRNGHFEVPSLEEFASSPIEMVPNC